MDVNQNVRFTLLGQSKKPAEKNLPPKRGPAGGGALPYEGRKGAQWTSLSWACPRWCVAGVLLAARCRLREWTLADGAALNPDGVLMVVVDEAGRAAMTVGPYEPLAASEPSVLAARALASAREALTTGVAPESLWAVHDGALTWGAAEDELPSGAATLVLDLAHTLGVAVTRDPRLADAVAAGEDPDAQVLLVSDEHGVVPASGCDDELAHRLAQGYATLLEKASSRPFGA